MLSAALFAAALSVGAVMASPYEGWQPHAYCNDVARMNASAIAPLTDEQAQRVESLVQVQIVARHGARAPYAPVFCWDKAGDNPLNANWTCTPTSVTSQNVGYKSSTGYGRLYRTAFMDGHNILKGTCTLGGLLPTGRSQHLANGQMLRHAYIGDGPLKLFSSDDIDGNVGKSIYLRSDDQERTLGSGQALMDGFFQPNETETSMDGMLTWHVADYGIDYVTINEGICPSLGELNQRNRNSKEYKKHVNSAPVKSVEKDFSKIVGKFDWESILECLSVARCTGIPLPSGITEDLFTKVFQEVEARTSIPMTMNDSEYSRRAMQPLVAEILGRLDAAINADSSAPRLAVTMGHDSTLMPLLAAIQRDNWDRKWTPYAGVLVFELYKTKTSHAVRLLHLGQPMKIPECKDTLCDVSEFMQAVAFARKPRDCGNPGSDDDEDNSTGVWPYLSTIVLVALAGVAVFLGLRHRRLTRQRGWEDHVELLP